MPNTKNIIILLIIIIGLATVTFAHPGRTDSLGCHYCRTNCEEKWDIPYGFYHRHSPVRACFEKGAETPSIPNLSKETEPILPPRQNPTYPSIEIYRVIDGDTIELTNGERVRLIGIDSAEVGQCYYLEAKNKLEELLQGKEIRLEKDISERDMYGRLLSYVYVDNIFINYELVRYGYAKAYRYEPDVKFADEFKETEKKAKEEKLGLWNKCLPSLKSENIGTETITGKVIEEKTKDKNTASVPSILTKETGELDNIVTNITPEVRMEKIENKLDISIPIAPIKEAEKPIEKVVIKEANQTNVTKIIQKQSVQSLAKKEMGFLQLIKNLFLRLFR